MVNLTASFYDTFLTEFYADMPDIMFIRVEPSLDFTLYQAGVPDPQFNIYMQYETVEMVFAPESTTPTSEDAFSTLRESINQDYILSYVRSLTDSPFFSTNEVIFRASNMENPNPDSRSGENLQKTRDSDENALPIATMAVASAAAIFVLAAGLLAYRRTRAARRLAANYDGINYSLDDKPTLDGYFSERSVTDVSDSASRFPPLPMVKEEDSKPVHVRV